MAPLLREIRINRLLWLLVFVPILFVVQRTRPESHVLLFMLSILAIVPLAGCSAAPPWRWPPRPATRSAAWSMRRSAT